MDVSSNADIFKAREAIYVAELKHLQNELWRVRQSNVSPELSGSVFGAFSDPLANLEIKELRLRLYEKDTDIRALKDKLEDRAFRNESEFKASETGKRLISKLKYLSEENKQLGTFKNSSEDNRDTTPQKKSNETQKHHLKQLWRSYLECESENERQVSEKVNELETAKSHTRALRQELRELKACRG